MGLKTLKLMMNAEGFSSNPFGVYKHRPKYEIVIGNHRNPLISALIIDSVLLFFYNLHGNLSSIFSSSSQVDLGSKPLMGQFSLRVLDTLLQSVTIIPVKTPMDSSVWLDRLKFTLLDVSQTNSPKSDALQHTLIEYFKSSIASQDEKEIQTHISNISVGTSGSSGGGGGIAQPGGCQDGVNG